jgi:hypothetical protein
MPGAINASSGKYRFLLHRVLPHNGKITFAMQADYCNSRRTNMIRGRKRKSAMLEINMALE